MKVLVLAHANVDGWYAASLMQRGHIVEIWGGGYTGPETIRALLKENDGCLKVDDSHPDHGLIAREFEIEGKKVWEHLSEIPSE
jgi:hypothetical protein